MKLYRIWAVILRYTFLFKHSLDRQVDAFYWPTVDLVLWGVTSTYLASKTSFGHTAVVMIVSGIILWIMLWRGQYEFTVNILEDMWNKNLVNMFVSPLKLSEWIAAFVTLGLVKSFISVSFAGLIALILYKANLFIFGFKLLPILFLLLMCGWWVGLFVGGLIIRFGGKVQNFAWSMVFLIAPFSAVYYPLSALPLWAQKISVIVPPSYLFESAREVLLGGNLDIKKITIAFLLNCVYIAAAIWFFRKSFAKVLQKGLVKLY